MIMNKTNFKQYDTRWASLGYPKKPWYIKNCGCGEVSIANSIIEMVDYANETPKTIQPYCKQYADSQYRRGRPYIGEYLDEVTGYWLKGENPRSDYYNHSTWADLIVTGLVGLRPREDDVLEVNPLVPEARWNWFCMDGISYRGHDVTVLWDKDGRRYGKGAGMRIWVDGRLVSVTPGIAKAEIKL